MTAKESIFLKNFIFADLVVFSPSVSHTPPGLKYWVAFSFLPSSEKSTCIPLHLQSILHFVVVFVQLLSCVRLFENPWIAAYQAPLSSNVSQSLIKFMSVETVLLYNISSSVSPFSCPQSFPASGSFLMSWFCASDDQNSRASASASVLPMNIPGWFPLGLTGWIFLQSKGFSRVFSSTTIWRHQLFSPQPSLWSNSHNCT